MGDVYDLFTKKKVVKPKTLSYHERNKHCMRSIQKTGTCECIACKDKRYLSKRLFDIVRYLCKDHKDKTGRDLYVADALELVLATAMRLKIEITK